jgi:hypothetical protein
MAHRTRKVGRPPKPEGAGSVNISLRINETLLAQLRNAADRAGHGNLSREISRRLWVSLSDSLESDRPTQAYCFLISQLASKVHFHRPNWHHDAYFVRAFKLAVNKLLEAFEPQKKIRTPEFLKMLTSVYTRPGHPLHKWTKRLAESPEALADEALKLILQQYQFNKPYHAGMEEIADKFDSPLPPGFKMGDAIDHARDAHYGMEHAKRDLRVSFVDPSRKRKA